MLETAKVILDFGVSGILLAVLVGLFFLVKTFAPQVVKAIVDLAGSLGKFGERIESFGDKLDGIGVKVDASRERASEAAQESTLTREAFRTGSYPAVTAQQTTTTTTVTARVEAPQGVPPAPRG